jgi:hypothetical protein
MSAPQRQGTPDTSLLLSSSSGGGGSAPTTTNTASSPLRISQLDRIDSRSSRDFAWHPHPPPMPGSSPSTGGGFLGPRLGSSSSLGGGATGYQSIDGQGLATLSRSSSSAADVFSAGSGLLLRDGEDPEGKSPRERNRRCPFVIGVAGGTGETGKQIVGVLAGGVQGDLQALRGEVCLQSSSGICADSQLRCWSMRTVCNAGTCNRAV